MNKVEMAAAILDMSVVDLLKLLSQQDDFVPYAEAAEISGLAVQTIYNCKKLTRKRKYGKVCVSLSELRDI